MSRPIILNRPVIVAIAFAILLYNFNFSAFSDLASEFGDSGAIEISQDIVFSDHVDQQNGLNHEHDGGAGCHGAVCDFFKIDTGEFAFMVFYTTRHLIDAADQWAVISHDPPYRPPILTS